MKTSTFAVWLALTTPILAVPLPTSQKSDVEKCDSYSSCQSSIQAIARIWHSKHAASDRPFKDLESSLTSEPHFPAHQLTSAPNPDHIKVGIVDTPHIALLTKEKLDGNRLLPPPMAEKASESSNPEPSRDPSLEAVFRGTHEDAAKSAQAAERVLQQIRKSEELNKNVAKTDVMPTQTNGMPIPTSVLLQASKAASTKCCIENEDMKDMIADGKRFGLTNWIKSNCAMIRDGKTITYTYSYVKRDYTDVIVVGLVMIFLIAVVLIELLQKLVDTSRSFFGQSSTTVEWDCECGREMLPPYAPRDFQSHLPLRSPRSFLEQWVDEKTGETYVIETAQDH